MEMSGAILLMLKEWWLRGCMFFLLMLAAPTSYAQPPVKEYTVSNGNLKIMLSKDLKEKDLDAFIEKYDLGKLALKQFIAIDLKDSVLKQGWKIAVNSASMIVITKPLFSTNILNDPEDVIGLTGIKNIAGGEQALMTQAYGVNMFRNGHSFTVNDTVVTFLLRNNKNAQQVKLAGNFTSWETAALPMLRTADGWALSVKLKPGKYIYKFIADGNWLTDPENLTVENDGEGNTNSVYYVTNTIFKLDGYANAKKAIVTGSFNNWQEDKLRMTRTATGWELPVYLNEGVYTYRFIVDGSWMTDPGNPNRFPNEHNDFNSFITIGKATIFTLAGHKAAQKVFLAGSFNQWHSYELQMARTDSGWQIPYVLGAGNYEYKFYADGHWLDAQGNEVKEDAPGSIIVTGANYTFRFKNEQAKSVFVAGDMNGWSPNAYRMRKEGDEWILSLHLSPGKHLYKLLVDGKWIIDPGNKLWEENEYGTGNSVLWIK